MKKSLLICSVQFLFSKRLIVDYVCTDNVLNGNSIDNHGYGFRRRDNVGFRKAKGRYLIPFGKKYNKSEKTVQSA